MGRPWQKVILLSLFQRIPPIQPSWGRACGDDQRSCYFKLSMDHFKSHFITYPDNRMWLTGDTVTLSFGKYRQYTVFSWVSTPVLKTRFQNLNQCEYIQMTQRNQKLKSFLTKFIFCSPVIYLWKKTKNGYSVHKYVWKSVWLITIVFRVMQVQEIGLNKLHFAKVTEFIFTSLTILPSKALASSEEGKHC